MKSNNANHQSVKIAVFAILALWFVFALLMSLSGQYNAGPQKPPLNLGLTILFPTVLFLAAYLRRGSLWAFAQTLDLKFLTRLHVGRLVGLLFLVDYLQGQLPAGFALPAGIGDIIAGLAAVPLSLAMSQRSPSVRKWFIAWNIFGLLDLFVAVSSGILHSPSSLGMMAGAGPTTALMGEFPLSMIPTFFVPLYVLLHLLALARANEIETKERPGECTIAG